MSWMPFFLTLASASFLIPMLMGFQKQVGMLTQRRRAGEERIRDAENNIKEFREAEEEFKKEMEAVKARMSAMDEERETLERKLLSAKIEHASGTEEGGEGKGT